MALEIEVPQFSIDVMEMDKDTFVMMLVASSSGQQARVFLCEVSQNYQDIAKQIHDKICQAGNEGRRAKRQHGLVLVRDLPDALKNGLPDKMRGRD